MSEHRLVELVPCHHGVKNQTEAGEKCVFPHSRGKFGLLAVWPVERVVKSFLSSDKKPFKQPLPHLGHSAAVIKIISFTWTLGPAAIRAA